MRDPEVLGLRAARRLRPTGERPDVRALAAQAGVEVVERQVPPPAQPRLRSQYQPDPPRIILYRNPIDELAEAASARERLSTAECDLYEVHIAHELFHHLERAERLGPLAAAEAEEAAHAFARGLLGLDFDPRELSGAGR
ncbi:MAG: hypothetical protein JSV79_02695 [Armatimonadota bacterium]|nr:MAG: hypothetical protein JSV79_02695 [Armatimonadota bacterium]